MLIAISKYLGSLNEVDKKRIEHINYINNYVISGIIILAGRQVSNEGAVILAHNISHEEFEHILSNDPYVKNNLAKYTIFEFHPGIYGENIQKCIENLKIR